jgi:two-component system cell cycle sensor histidine kinase/response regulator CckA
MVGFLHLFPVKRSDNRLNIDLFNGCIMASAVTDSLKELRDLRFALDEHAIVAITDQTGKIVYVNDKFCAISKYDRRELIGQDHRIINSGHHPKEFIRELWQTIARGHVWKGEFRNRAKDGSFYWVDTTIVPFLNDEGKPYQYVTIRVDISERKRAEEQRADLEEKLRQSQKIEAVGRLAGGVAHDFNNMLMVIRGQCEMMLVGIGPEAPHLRSRAQEIIFTVDRAASLTTQLLAFSRQQVVELEVLELEPLLRDFTKMIIRVLGEDVRLTFAMEPDLGKTVADQGLLTQVLLNLSLNARDAMPHGGRLIIEAGNQVIEPGKEGLFHDVPAGNYCCISVTDTGSGMAPEVKSHVFEPFFTTKEKGKGTGLGLATVLGIIGQLNGHVRFYSDLGRGTTFRIYLLRSDASTQEPAPSANHQFQAKGVVLLVEDEDALRSVIRDYLRSLGLEVCEAKNGYKALLYVREHHPDISVIITDMVMPEMGGLEMMTELQYLGYEARVILMSGYTDRAIDVCHGGDGPLYLQKPFKLQELSQRLAQVLSPC